MATQVQSEISGVLNELKFESLGGEMPGAPGRFQATAETVRFVQSLVDQGKVVEVDSAGELSFAAAE